MQFSEAHLRHRFALRARMLLSLILVLALSFTTAFSQNSSSGVNGVITDPAGAVIAGAQVTLINVATSVQRKTVTNGTGNYFFTGVPPASYTLSVTATGFQKQTITAFSVGVAQTVTINPTLRLGSVSQSVTVQASGTQVESSTAQLGTVISDKTVSDLPLDGRNFTQLLDLTPGVTPISTSQNSSAGNTDVVSGSDYSFPSINGAYNRSTTYLLDGINDNQAWYNSNGFTGGEVNSPSKNLSSIHEWSGNVMKVIGNHSLQAGGGWDEANYTAELRQGQVSFTGASTANFSGNPGSAPGLTKSQISAQSGFGLADFLLDYPNNENKRNVLLTERPGGIASAYVQDSWKVTPKLTVNYGLRYDRSVIPQYGTEASVGLQGSIETGDFDFNNGTYILQQLPPLCSIRGHAPCLPSATLPPHVVVAIGKKIMHGSKMNLGPRFGIAWRVRNTTSVRAGFGIAYDNWATVIQMPQNYQGSWPDTGTLQINNTNTPGTPYTSAQNPFVDNGGNLPSPTPFSSSNVNYMVDPRWKNPYSEQYNFGIEQQIGAAAILNVNYVGSATHRMDVGGYYNTGTPGVAASFAQRQAAGTTGQPYPYIVPQKSWDHAGASASYNALQASFVRRFTSGLSYMISYTWSKTLDEGGDGFFGVEGGVPEDPYNPRGSRGPASFDIPQMFTGNFLYELPFGRTRLLSTGNRVLDYVIGHWQTNGIVTVRSGQNFSVMADGDIANTGNAKTYERANLVGDPWRSGAVADNPSCVPPPGQVHTRTQWFNPCAFVAPAISTLGTGPRNTFRDQPFWNFDASVFRQFPIHDTLAFSIRAEAFNAFNHPVLGSPGSTVTSPSSFGQITSLASGNDNRILQFSGRLSF